MKLAPPRNKAFTLIEIMLVVAIIGIALAMGMPSIRRMGTPDPMTAAVKDVMDVCTDARAKAILKGVTMEVRIYPQAGRFEVVQAPEDANLLEPNVNADGTGTPATASAEVPAPAPVQPEAGSGSSSSAQLSDRVAIEMCDINFGEYKEEEMGRVRFHPNGICDNFTLVLKSDKNEYKKISLEEVTGLIEVSDVK